MKVRFVTANRVAFNTRADIFRDVLDAVVVDNLEVGIGSFAHDVRFTIGEGSRSSASDEGQESRALEMHDESIAGDGRWNLDGCWLK